MQNFERKSLQDPSRRAAARALMTLLACSPAAQTHAAKGLDTLFSLLFFCCYSWFCKVCFSWLGDMHKNPCVITVFNLHQLHSTLKRTDLCASGIHFFIVHSSWHHRQLCGANEAESLATAAGVGSARQDVPQQESERSISTGRPFVRSTCSCRARIHRRRCVTKCWAVFTLALKLFFLFRYLSGREPFKGSQAAC